MNTSVISLIISILVLGTMVANAQNDSQMVYNAINAQRERMNLPPLIYRISEQLPLQERVQEISFNFALSEDCDCDYESIAGDNSLLSLVQKMTNIRRYQWLHFEEDAKFTTIAVVKREGIFYCVVRTYVN